MMWPPRPPPRTFAGGKAPLASLLLRGMLRKGAGAFFGKPQRLRPAPPPSIAWPDPGSIAGAASAALYGPAGFRSAVPGAGSARRRRRRLYEARLAACLLAAGLCGRAPTGEGGRLTRRSRRPSARRVYAGPRGTAREPRRPGESARAENENAPTAAPHYADAFGPTGPA